MKTRYNWVNIPRQIQYIAVDRSGKCYGYVTKPTIRPKSVCWQPFNDEEVIFLGDVSYNNWRNSLEQRPPLDDTRAHIEAIIKNVLQDEDSNCGNEALFSIIASRCTKEIMKALNLDQ